MASTIPAAYMGMTTVGTVTADWDAAACALRICHVARHAEARSVSDPSEGGKS
jgi:hypothetical protein